MDQSHGASPRVALGLNLAISDSVSHIDILSNVKRFEVDYNSGASSMVLTVDYGTNPDRFQLVISTSALTLKRKINGSWSTVKTWT